LKQRILAALLLALSFGSLLAFAYPGFMTADSFHQLREAVTGIYTSDQPAVMSWLWRKLLVFAPETAPQLPMLVFHLLCFQLGLFFTFHHYFPRNPLRNAFFVLLLSLYPPLVGSLGNIWKDVGQIATWVLAIAFFLGFKRSRNKVWLIPFLILLFYGMLTRHNSPPALWPLFFWLFHILRPTWTRTKKVLVSFAFLVLFFASGMLFSKILTHGHDKHFLSKYTLFDLAGISVYSGSVQLPSYMQNPPWTVEEIRKVYTPRSNVALGAYPGQRAFLSPQTPAEVQETFRLWYLSILRFPDAYSLHRLKVTAAMLGLTTWQEYPYFMGIQEANPPNTFGLKLEMNGYQRLWQNILDSLAQGPLFRGYVYLSLLLIFVGLALANKSEFKTLALVLGFSNFLNLATLAVMTGAADFRYNLWMLVCSMILLLCTAGAKLDKAVTQK
jgi:hypothetical protein